MHTETFLGHSKYQQNVGKNHKMERNLQGTFSYQSVPKANSLFLPLHTMYDAIHYDDGSD